MGFFTQTMEDNGGEIKGAIDRRPFFSPGTYHAEIVSHIHHDKDARLLLWGLNFDILEVVQGFTAEQNAPFDASRRVGSGAAIKYNLRAEWAQIMFANALAVCGALFRTHGFEDAVNKLSPKAYATLQQMQEAFEGGNKAANPAAAIADMVSEHPDLFCGLIVKITNDELLGKDGQRRAKPMTKDTVVPVDEATYRRLKGLDDAS